MNRSRPDPAERARQLGVSVEAVDLAEQAEVVDLHIESFIWTRVFGYDLNASHGRGLLGGRLLGQADLPRLRSAGLTGAVLSIATNPMRGAARRQSVTLANVDRLTRAVERGGDAAVVHDASGYWAARDAGRLACFLALQGGNAVTVEGVASLPESVSRVTLVHLTPSVLGRPSAAVEWITPGRGLSATGHAYVEALVARRIIVDLAHAGARTFWDALAVHGKSQPPVVSHTGVRGVHDCWRNIDDSQIRAIAQRGGVVGVMFHGSFLGESSPAAVVRHLQRVIDIGGEGAAAIGSDWDGFIVPPVALRSAERLPVLVQAMLDGGFSDERVRRVLGGNALRVIADTRP